MAESLKRFRRGDLAGSAAAFLDSGGLFPPCGTVVFAAALPRVFGLVGVVQIVSFIGIPANVSLRDGGFPPVPGKVGAWLAGSSLFGSSGAAPIVHTAALARLMRSSEASGGDRGLRERQGQAARKPREDRRRQLTRLSFSRVEFRPEASQWGCLVDWHSSTGESFRC
eukprot:scaffold7558_cov277-Pinguiococcus_pyrenoidosus.AAC.5